MTTDAKGSLQIVPRSDWRQAPPTDEGYLILRKAGDAQLQPHAPLILQRNEAKEKHLQDFVAKTPERKEDKEARGALIDFTLSKEDLLELLSAYLTVMPDSDNLHPMHSTSLSIKFVEGAESMRITHRNERYHIDLSRDLQKGLNIGYDKALGCDDLLCAMSYITPFIKLNDVAQISVFFYTSDLPIANRRTYFYHPRSEEKTLDKSFVGSAQLILYSAAGVIIRRVAVNKDGLRDGVEELFFFTNSGRPLVTRYWINGVRVCKKDFDKRLSILVTTFSDILPDLSTLISTF